MAKIPTVPVTGKLKEFIEAHYGTGVTINLNIQLTLPTTENEKVYENIFKALKDNLLTREPKKH